MEQMEFDERREQLLDTAPWVIDFLPRQVPADCGGNYFAVEQYMMAHPQVDELYGRFARFLVKLSCYYDMAAYDPQSDSWHMNPGPEELTRQVEICILPGKDRYLQLLCPAQSALLTLDPGDLYMALYTSHQSLLETVTQLAGAEGLFVRRGAWEG